MKSSALPVSWCRERAWMCLLTGNPSGASDQQTTTVLENVAVIATGQKLERNTAGEPQLTPVITLLVSPDDAQKLTLATTQGKIQLALRNPLDTKQQELASVSTGSLYKGVPPPTPVAAPRPKSTGHACREDSGARAAAGLFGRSDQGNEARRSHTQVSQHSEEADMSIRSRMWEKHEVNLSPVVRWVLSVLLLLTASLAAVAQDPPATQPAPAPAQAPGPEASSSAPQAAAQGSAPLRVMVGKSLLINTTERLTPGLRHR